MHKTLSQYHPNPSQIGFPSTIHHLIRCLSWIPVILGVCMTTAAVHGEESKLAAALKFTAGVATAYAIHEGAHAAAAAYTGTELEWEVGTYNQPIGFTENARDDTSGLIIHASGLITQAAAGEIILQWDRLDKNDNFTRGMMVWNIINPIIYALDYWLIGQANQTSDSSFQGDIQGVEHYSDKPTADVFALSIAAIAGYQGYRFLKTQTWAPDWMKTDDYNLGMAPLERGGVLLTVNIPF
ncbi:MAG: hypothetical protein HKM93_20690 [Desulfobacteraceae bacterium]|nr:hypothetical protein [Desulfobacteraceae bacterium]